MRVSIDTVKQIHKGFFFSANTLAAFKSSISNDAWEYDGGYVFYTSCEGPRRRWTARKCDATGAISNLSRLRQFATRKQCRDYIENALVNEFRIKRSYAKL